MKKFKKMMALAIAMVMVLSMSMAVFADDEPVTITIQNGEYDTDFYTKGADEINYATHTYTAAQILAATAYDSTKDEYTGLTWGAQVTDPAALLTALKADATWGTTFANYVIAAADVDDTHPQFTAASFAKAISTAADSSAQAKALAQVLKGLYAGQGTAVSGTSEVALPGIGYYLIDDTTTSLTDDAANPVILFAAPGSNKIRIKADKPSQDKQVKENEAAKTTAASLDDQWNEVSDYSIGDAVPYRITSKVPNADAYTTYNMKFTDTMSSGLTLYELWTGEAPTNTTAANLKVTIGTTDVTNQIPAANITKTAQGFELTLPIKANGTQATWAPAGADITIEFFGVLNQSAVIGLDGNTNKSKLEYSNNPDDDTSKTETPEDTVITFTYELDVNKIDGATEYALPGAQFALKATDGEHSGKYAVVNADGKIVKWQDAAPAADAAAVDGLNALLVSDASGNFNVTGLDDGKYSLEEIKAPAGYNTIDAIAIEIIGGTVHTADGESAAAALTSLDITANGAETIDGNINAGTVGVTVENNSGATLPETGGIGTTLFYVIGAILVIGAGILLVTRRRMSAN